MRTALLCIGIGILALALTLEAGVRDPNPCETDFETEVIGGCE